MTCNETEKPKDIPYYYRAHNIVPEEGNDWYCEDGVWIWTVRGREEKQVDEYERDVDKAPYKPLERASYGVIRYGGVWRTVWIDSVYGDFISVDGKHYQLKKEWWTTHEKRNTGESQILKEIPRKSIEEVFSDKRWDMPDLPNINFDFPSLPDLSGLKGSLQVTALVFIIVILIIVYMLTGKGEKGVTVAT